MNIFPLKRAGQTLPTGWQWDTNANGDPIPVDASGNPIPLPAGATYWSVIRTGDATTYGIPVALNDTGNVISANGASTPGLTQPQQSLLASNLVSLIGGAASDVIAALNGQNDQELTQIQQQTETQLATLQAQPSTPQTRQNIATLKMGHAIVRQQSGGSNTGLIVLAVVVLAGVLLVVMSGRGETTRRNPWRWRRTRRRRR